MKGRYFVYFTDCYNYFCLACNRFARSYRPSQKSSTRTFSIAQDRPRPQLRAQQVANAKPTSFRHIYRHSLLRFASSLTSASALPTPFIQPKRQCYTKSEPIPNQDDQVTIRYERGLPIITVPLPSRRESCQFSLKPVSDTVLSLCEYVIKEDKGIDFVVVYSLDGTRIAGSTSIEHLLQLGDFRLRINDSTYTVTVPPLEKEISSLIEVSSSDKLRILDDLRSKIASLHAIFNVDEFKVERERILIEKLEEVEQELKPLDELKSKIDAECEKHSERVMWSFFVAMGLQTGIFARLTWWEYSWDIMEPVTYFATYATVIATYGYYLYTRQEFEYSTMRNRCYTKYFYKVAEKYKFNVERYNELLDLTDGIRKDLSRLRDPLYQHLPATHLAWALKDASSSRVKSESEMSPDPAVQSSADDHQKS